jgi:osmotically-inducible protein OsmY
LEGVVDAYWKKDKAEDLVSNLIGVKGVENKLVIAPTGGFIDQTVAEKIMAALECRFPVKADKVNVSVIRGEVTLTGTLPTWSARQAASNAAGNILGVTKVNNEITIAD